MAIEPRRAQAAQVAVTDDALTVDLVDGRTVSVPLAWYPRLAHGTSADKSNWRLIGRGEGIHWADLDEDISVERLDALGQLILRVRKFRAATPPLATTQHRTRRAFDVAVETLFVRRSPAPRH